MPSSSPRYNPEGFLETGNCLNFKPQFRRNIALNTQNEILKIIILMYIDNINPEAKGVPWNLHGTKKGSKNTFQGWPRDSRTTLPLLNGYIRLWMTRSIMGAYQVESNCCSFSRLNGYLTERRNSERTGFLDLSRPVVTEIELPRFIVGYDILRGIVIILAGSGAYARTVKLPFIVCIQQILQPFEVSMTTSPMYRGN